MTENGGHISSAVTGVGLFATVILATGSVETGASDFVREQGAWCLATGAWAAFAFYFGNWGDASRSVSNKQLVGQTMITFMISCSIPPIYHTYVDAKIGVGTFALMGLLGSLFAYALYNSGSVWIRAKREDGSLLGTAWRFVVLLVGRAVNAIPEPAKIVNKSTPDIQLTVPLTPGVAVEVTKPDGHTTHAATNGSPYTDSNSRPEHANPGQPAR